MKAWDVNQSMGCQSAASKSMAKSDKGCHFLNVIKDVNVIKVIR
jgi:hypothetical protein